MKSQLTKYLLLVLMAFLPVLAYAQGKVYTRKVRIADFPIRTAMVVIDPDSQLCSLIREEVVSRWRISPYEFCSPQDYDRLKTRNDLYFLRIEEDGGIVYLVFSKGGVEKDDDPRKEYLEVVRLPAAVKNSEQATENFVDAYVDIIQRFVEDAASSDNVAYSGLKHYNVPGITRRPKDSYDRVVVGPYVMIIEKGSNSLLMFRKRNTNGESAG